MSSAELDDKRSGSNVPYYNSKLGEGGEESLEVREVEDDDEEDEDFDFNPSAMRETSAEASSSLSSEVECLDADVVESRRSGTACREIDSLESRDEVEVEIQMQDGAGPSGSKEEEDRRTSVSESECEVITCQEKNDSLCDEAEVGNDINAEELRDGMNCRNPVLDFDNEDAICKRTRARYSLAGFTLDELETFLQETDDEDDLQNVDDEEEYKKFLAAVLGGKDNSKQDLGSENVDDDDEDNDADFEIEIEEALESDIDENVQDENAEDVYKKCDRRPETRQKKRQKASKKQANRTLELVERRPLRPLVPIMPVPPMSQFTSLDGRSFVPDTAPYSWSSTAENGALNGFSLHQLGQLYCLIHEHVQLLIQVFSLCVSEPSRQHIASQVEQLILELHEKRNQALRCRTFPYPSYCFRTPYIHPSVPSELPKPLSASLTSAKPDAPQDSLSTCLHGISPSRCEQSEQQSSRCAMERFIWTPVVTGPLLSILDVSPLNLLGRYIDDVKTAVQEYQRRYVKDNLDTRFDKEPLFPSFSSSEVEGEVLGESMPSPGDMLPSSLSSYQPPKKTLAANLIESSKKQPVALVPKDIVKLAQRFFPLFNPALYPRKPPPAAIANRVLFTTAEDELLAIGLMQFNTDWKAIQQHFLPCKSTNQIFIRQKNSCASKAPENPIKAVRRMKTSPLTADEIARIHEGLKIWKHDWTSVCKFVVPYRDPSLLPRQWRCALGSQKSYKYDSDKKERRRLYEAKRRRRKAAELAGGRHVSDKVEHQFQNTVENNSGVESVEKEDASCVHEAFLADWRPTAFATNSSELPSANVREKHLCSSGPQTEQACGSACTGSPSCSSKTELAAVLHNPQHSRNIHLKNFTTNSMELNHQGSDSSLKSTKTPLVLRPYRSRQRNNNANVVKLGPGLPPLNLPPSVRVISQSAFRSLQCGGLVKDSSANGNIGSTGVNNMIPKHPQVKTFGTPHPNVMHAQSDPQKIGGVNSHLEAAVLKNRLIREDDDAGSDLQMHPLLFKAPEERGAPYYSMSSTNISSSFSFFSGNRSSGLSLFNNPHQAVPRNDCSLRSNPKEISSSSFGIDFHPLLQRVNDLDSNLATNPTPACPYEKTNELDLEIHLSSTSRRNRPGGSKDADKYPAQSSATNNDSVLTPISTTMQSNMDHVDEQSVPEIVMEQEELSDTDDEIGEHVEFECEEMADSEGDEGAAHGRSENRLEKEIPHFRTDENSTAVCDGQLGGQSQDHGKDPANGSSWLSLDSSAFGSPHAKAELVDSRKSKAPALESSAPCRPIRPGKKRKPNITKAVSAKHTVDALEQVGPSTLTVNKLKKPRKRVCKTNLDLNTSTNVDISNAEQC